jgi:tetratricopeptide (TPR) repeat protein
MKNRFYLLILLVFSFVLSDCSEFSQRTVQPSNQEKIFKLLNGIRDKADVEGYGMLEYELYDVPGNESSDFQTFIRSYLQTLDEYVFVRANNYWIEDNTVLSKNVKTIMTNNKRNLSTTQILNHDGSMSFIFNCLNSNGKYEYYTILAYKKNMSVSQKTTVNPVRHDFAEAYIRQGWLYYWKEDYDKAITNFTEAIRLDPEKKETYSIRGWAYYWKKEYDQAITDFSELIRLDPNQADTYYSRGESYFLKEDFDRAIVDYTKAIKLDPNRADTYFSRGWAYYMKNDFDRAIVNYTESIRLDPKGTGKYLSRGFAYYERNNRGDLERAIADYEAALRINPDDTLIKQYHEDARQKLQSQEEQR